VIANNGKWETVLGTSASAPTVASLIALLNDVRLRAGKSPVGFINPVLYGNPSAMNDIVTGNNFGCNETAFEAGLGWDPVTGLGTLDFERLKTIYEGLP
jgi:tripeptidyl-peptidase-1